MVGRMSFALLALALGVCSAYDVYTERDSSRFEVFVRIDRKTDTRYAIVPLQSSDAFREGTIEFEVARNDHIQDHER